MTGVQTCALPIADDCLFLVKSRRATERVRDSIATLLEKKLFLRVNMEKTVIRALQGKKFLGYFFYWRTDKRCGLGLHRTSRDTFLRTLKQLTKRSNGKGYLWLKNRLTYYIRGWIVYFKLADMRSFVVNTVRWYHRRLRKYIWKSWKRVRTKYTNLIKCGISKWRAYQWDNIRLDYWRISNSWILTRALTSERLDRAGYPRIMSYYTKLHRN